MSLLVYNGLRIAEVLGCDVESFTHQRGHRVLRIVRNGGKKVAIVYQEDAYGKFGAEFAQKLSKDLGFTVVESVAMLIAFIYVVLNLIADLLVMLLVQKLREPA